MPSPNSKESYKLGWIFAGTAAKSGENLFFCYADLYIKYADCCIWFMNREHEREIVPLLGVGAASHSVQV